MVVVIVGYGYGRSSVLRIKILLFIVFVVVLYMVVNITSRNVYHPPNNASNVCKNAVSFKR